ncbi:glycosyltransferase family 4 protein [Pectinatus haikarae]|uniref:Glycosyltransferase involved in cell wall biosynthesis n=1 Tax=Pectinatus haikarae TaxID=349096 RepID=A0ABT9YCJ1_9FIRM|nr:glycosyltransferase family 4 protein [Pectinatus haikarae]MDQ0205185.1 glycosyltransferase involved in cell wall biosynthesis [Pectinatus haikarae]
MRIAVVCDWLVVYAGAERVLEEILNIYPDADLFCVVDFLEESQRGFIKNKKTHSTFVQKLPMAKSKYRYYLPFMPIAIEQLDVSEYDIVISSSHAVAKGILTGPGQLHVCYVHTPIRYAWDLQHEYLKDANLTKGIKSWITRIVLHYIRMWDYRTANGVDYFVANSNFIAERVKKIYNRKSEVIYPPIDINKFEVRNTKEDFYLTVSRMVSYKKINLIVEAFNGMPNKKLVVIGDGPEYKNIKDMCGPNIILMGYQIDDVLHEYMKNAKAFIFAAREDFGIVMVEAQACGTPVIAYGKGGALEIVKNGRDNTAATGSFFYEQSADSIRKAINTFENIEESSITANNCRKNAEKFSVDIFRCKFKEFVDECFNNI